MRKLTKSGGNEKFIQQRELHLGDSGNLGQSNNFQKKSKKRPLQARRMPHERRISNTEERKAAALCYGWVKTKGNLCKAHKPGG